MTDGITRRSVLRGLGASLGGALIDQATGAVGIQVSTELLLATPAPDILRIVFNPTGVARAVDDDVLDRGVSTAKGSPVALTGESKTVRCGKFSVRITNEPLVLQVSNSAGRLVQRLRFAAGDSLGFDLDAGPLLGLGQGGPQFDRRGRFHQMNSGQDGRDLAIHGARVPIPWLIGTKGHWALFIHSPVGAFDLSGTEGRFAPDQAGATMDVFLVSGDSPAAIMRAYARITGLPEMPPLWSFGYQQSHRTLGTPEEVLSEARRFRENRLPCDTMIYLGTGFCPNGWNTNNGEFTWNSRVFPDPPQAIAQLHDANFKVVLHVVVEGHKMTGHVADACSAAPLPSGRLPDGTWPPDRQVACYWPLHRPLLDLGIDGWWPDQGDGFDAPSRLARNRMYFEGQQLYRPNRRVFALHRNGFAGMQRFAAFLWSGDVESRWETLATHLPVAINTGLSAIPYWGTDIGGFVATDEYSGELFVRWFQFAAFTPLFRSHGRDWRMHTPWGWSDGERGAPETAKWHPDAASLEDPRVEPICRSFLELRYRLLQYLYCAVREACVSGIPILRALWLHYPDDPAAVARPDQYLYGRDVLVAPVVVKAASERRVYLPRGVWYDFWNGHKLEGGREIVRPVDLATLPLYVRAGAILPLGPVKQYVSESSSEATELRIHPGADGHFQLYEDDGESFDYRRGRYRLTDIRWDNDKRKLTVAPATGKSAPTDPLPPVPCRFNVTLAGESHHAELHYDGRRPATLTLGG
jgi:alpha-glucosidase (family GH31 glycosyl hydrolase)